MNNELILIGIILFFVVVFIVLFLWTYENKKNGEEISPKKRLAIYQEMMFKYNVILNGLSTHPIKSKANIGLCAIYENISSKPEDTWLVRDIKNLPELEKSVKKHPKYAGFIGLGCFWFKNNDEEHKVFMNYRMQALESAIKEIKRKYKIK